MHPSAVRRHLRKVAREQQAAVQAGVERPQVIDIVILHLDAAENLIPGASGPFFDFVEWLPGALPEIDHRLLRRDE